MRLLVVEDDHLLNNVVIPFNQPEEKAGLWDMPENIIRP